MEILLWLVPPAVVTLAAMLWVAWLGRDGRGEVDRDEAVRRMAVALEKDRTGPVSYPRPPRERSTGVAVRRPRPPSPGEDSGSGSGPSRRAS